MRSIICSILIGKAPAHQRIFSDQITDEDVGNIFYAISSMGMQITVYNGQDKANHVKATPGEYPVIILYQNGRNFSLLYTAKMIEIETNPNFSKNDVENPPFLIDTCRRIRGNPPASNLRNPHNPNLIPQNVSAPQYIQGHANLSNPQAMNTGPPNFAPPYARIPSSQAPKPALNQGPPKYPLPSGGPNLTPNLPNSSNQGSQNFSS